MKSYAEVDDKLSSSQLAIGQSSNLAQLCLTYSYNFDDKVYKDNVDILAVIAQLAIDSAKKSFDIDLNGEIERISQEIKVNENGLPLFWQITKKDKRKSRTDEERKDKIRKNKEKIRKRINKNLVCPMNEIFKLKLNEYKPTTSTLPISEFFINNQQDNNRRKSKKVEEFIEKYSIELHNFYVENENNNWEDSDELPVIKEDFENLIKDIRSIYISSNYLGLMSWLINRAFMITPNIKGKSEIVNSNTDKNKALLLKVLYEVNKDSFLSCFKKCTTSDN